MRLSLESLGELRPQGAASRPAQADGAAIDFGAVLQLLAAGMPAPVVPLADVAGATTKESAETGESTDTSVIERDAKPASELPAVALSLVTAPLGLPLMTTAGSPARESLTTQLTAAAVTPKEQEKATDDAIVLDPIAVTAIAPAPIELSVAALIPTVAPPALETKSRTPESLPEPIASTPALPLLPVPAAIEPVPVAVEAAPVAGQAEAKMPTQLKADDRVPAEIPSLPIINAADGVSAEETTRQAAPEFVAALPVGEAAREQIAERPAARLREELRPAVKNADGRAAAAKFDRVAETASAEATAEPRVVHAVAATAVHRDIDAASRQMAPAAHAESTGSLAAAEDGEPNALLRSQLIETMRVQIRDGGGRAEIRLHPDFLGGLKVSVVVDHGSVKATLVADTPAGLEHVQRNMDGLREALAERGLRLDECDVTEDPSASQFRRGEERESSQQRDEPRRTPRPATRQAPRGDGFAEVFDVVA